MAPPQLPAVEISKEVQVAPEGKADITEGTVAAVPTTDLPPLLRDLSADELKRIEKKLLRKMDIRLMPTLIIVYIMNYLDRSDH